MLSGIAYSGGKSIESHTKTGPWIASMLPYREAYAEPFAGMLGVLLQRKKSQYEMVNDLEGLICKFWECIRKHPDELEWRCANSPLCRKTYEDAWDIRDRHLRGEEFPVLDLAHAVAVILTSGYSGIMTSRYFASSVFSHHRRLHRFWPKIAGLHKRAIDIQIENLCALEFLDKTKDIADCVIYCDPPYPETGKMYMHDIPSKADFMDVLKQQKGLVAVSGYGAAFDDLDWHKEVKGVTLTVSKQTAQRTEGLWMNFKPEKQPSLLDGV